MCRSPAVELLRTFSRPSQQKRQLLCASPQKAGRAQALLNSRPDRSGRHIPWRESPADDYAPGQGWHRASPQLSRPGNPDVTRLSDAPCILGPDGSLAPAVFERKVLRMLRENWRTRLRRCFRVDAFIGLQSFNRRRLHGRGKDQPSKPSYTPCQPAWCARTSAFPSRLRDRSSPVPMFCSTA